MYESEFPATWTLLGTIDEAAPYEVDQTSVYKNGNGFVLATASGCSCWDGDWEVQKFRSLDRLFEAIGATGDRTGYHYNPSLEGAKTLREQVLASLA
jgi:hypothetical protein